MDARWTLEMGTELREREETLSLDESLPLSAVSLLTSLMRGLDQQISRGPSSCHLQLQSHYLISRMRG